VEAQFHAFLTLALDGEASDLLSRPWYLREELGALQGKPGSCGEKIDGIQPGLATRFLSHLAPSLVTTNIVQRKIFCLKNGNYTQNKCDRILRFRKALAPRNKGGVVTIASRTQNRPPVEEPSRRN
jgi:hypothetical protein